MNKNTLKQITFISCFIFAQTILCAIIFEKCENIHNINGSKTIIDTVIVRDTIFDIKCIPEKVYITRNETIYVRSIDTLIINDYKASSDSVGIVVPIQRKEYRTDDYFAIIEGYKPSLISIELYPETKYITQTTTNTVTKQKRFNVGIQLGYGYGVINQKPDIYVGLGVNYRIL